MGAKTSKPAQAATRKFPARAPGSAVPPSARPSRPPPSSNSSAGLGGGGGAAAAAGGQAFQGRRQEAPRASSAKDDSIRRDGQDPDGIDLNAMTNPAFSRRLQQLGVVTPQPTLSNSSTAQSSIPSSSSRSPYPAPSPASSQQNRTLNALEARDNLTRKAQSEFEKPGQGKEFLDIGTLKQILLLRARGTASADIERRLRLKSGVVERLGPKEMVVPASGR